MVNPQLGYDQVVSEYIHARSDFSSTFSYQIYHSFHEKRLCISLSGPSKK